MDYAYVVGCLSGVTVAATSIPFAVAGDRWESKEEAVKGYKELFPPNEHPSINLLIEDIGAMATLNKEISELLFWGGSGLAVGSCATSVIRNIDKLRRSPRIFDAKGNPIK